MADIKITQLPPVTTVAPDNDVLPLVSDGGTVTTKATPNNIVNAVLTAGTAITITGLVYPTTDGTSGYVMTTDGAGNLSLQPPTAISNNCLQTQL